jgi:hypothetical protein
MNKRMSGLQQVLLATLIEVRDAIAEAPPETFGMVSTPDGRYEWPVSAEMLSKIDAVITMATGEKGGEGE